MSKKHSTEQRIEATGGSTIQKVIQAVINIPAWALVVGIILGVGIISLTALIITGVIKLPTPMAFAPATEGQSLIIVADFEDRSGGKYQGIDPAQYIYEQLTAQAKKDNLDVRIERLRHTVDDNTVRPTGETYSATLLLWGWYDALSITPRVERIKTRTDYRSTEEGKHFGFADPTEVEFSIITDLPSQSTYLVLLVLGLDAYSDPVRGYDEALPYFNSAIEALPTNMTMTINPAETYFYRGIAYDDKGDADHAIADYDKAIQLKPDLAAAAYTNRGLIYAGQGDIDRAIADYDKAIQLEPDFTVAYNDRGIAYAYQGDYDRAIADFDQAIQLEPDYASAYNNRGSTYNDMGDTDRAIVDYSQAIQLEPDNANTYLNRGNVYAHIGDYDRAIADFSEAIKSTTNVGCLACAYNNRGIAYASQSDIDRAIADYDQLIQLKPDFAEAYANRGNAYTHQGNYDQAIVDYNKALQIAPNFAGVYMNRGLAYARKSDYDRAIADYDRTIQLNRRDVDAYVSRGLAYYRKGDADRAIADYDRVIQLEPDYAGVYYNRALAYKSTGKTDKAIVDFKKVLELSDDPNLRQYAQDALKFLGAQ